MQPIAWIANTLTHLTTTYGSGAQGTGTMQTLQLLPVFSNKLSCEYDPRLLSVLPSVKLAGQLVSLQVGLNLSSFTVLDRELANPRVNDPTDKDRTCGDFWNS